MSPLINSSYIFRTDAAFFLAFVRIRDKRRFFVSKVFLASYGLSSPASGRHPISKSHISPGLRNFSNIKHDYYFESPQIFKQIFVKRVYFGTCQERKLVPL